MGKRVINLATGEVSVVDLSQDETDAAAARVTAHTAQVAADAQEATDRAARIAALKTKLDLSDDDMTAIEEVGL